TSGSNYETAIISNGVGANFSDINTIRYYRSYDLSSPQIAADGTVSYPLVRQIRYPNDDTQDQPISANGDAMYYYLRDLYYELSLNYNRKFGNHDVSGLALANRRSLIRSGSGTY